MAAQSGASRRLGKTYGKTTRNQVVHDLFDYRGKQDDTPSTTSSAGSPAAANFRAPRTVTRFEQLDDVESPLLLSSPNTSKKAATVESKRSLVQDAHIFDIISSDDDISTDTSGSRASKRRRIVRTSVGNEPIIQKPLDAVSLNSKQPPINPKKRGQQAKTVGTSVAVVNITSKELPQPKASKELLRSGSSVPKSQPAQHKIPKPRPKPRITKSKSPVPTADLGKAFHEPGLLATDLSERRIDQANEFTAQVGMTSQRKSQSPARASSNLSSPSQLGMMALKLNTAAFSPRPHSTEASSDESITYQSGRRRLVDRLDAPSQSALQTSEGYSSDGAAASASKKKQQDFVRVRGKLTPGKDKHSRPTKPPLVSEGSQNAQNRTNLTTRPRMTYATQRSHLSDMVDGLDDSDIPLSQRSTEELLRQPVSSTLGLQLELEDDESDDKSGTIKLKSIHELRQAGVNNRFDREIDTLLEDINTSGRSSKALRIHALMKLTEKLFDAAFLRHLVNNGRVHRLTLVATSPVDLPMAMLLTGIFMSLACSEIVSLETLGHLFRGISDLATDMLQDDRPFATIVKDRKQNHSKAMINDLVSFEGIPTASTDFNFDVNTTRCDEMALTCLEHVLRRMIQQGDTSAKLPTSLYRQILQMLQAQVESARNNKFDPASIKQMEMVLSVLELCSVMAGEGDLRITDEEYQVLGDALAEILVHADQSHEPLERSVLRVVVSLSNNKARMCRLLGGTAISKAAFGIIDQNFLPLARQAEEENSLDGSKLDSVVLAIGCLLNFAECDSSLRTRLSKTTPGENNFIAQLVSIFNFQVSKVDEALTKEQSQVSVAFGYLSMLLCTLSLERAIRIQVTRLLKNKSFEELCAAAEKFFSHLRTLEHISDDDASMSTFTARFNTILETVRASKA